MKFFPWKKKKERRATAGMIEDFFGYGSLSSSGMVVTPDTAMTYTAVFRAVSLLSQSVATLPLFVFRRLSAGGKERAVDHPLYNILHTQPNPDQNSVEFREMMMGHLLLRGNAYAKIETTGSGAVKALVPLNPDRMSPYRNESGAVIYRYRPQSGGEQKYTRREIFHIRGLSSDGLVGLNPIEYCRESIGLGLAAENYGSTFFGNSAKPSGVLTYPNHLDDPGVERLKKEWNAAHGGPRNANTVAVLEDGMKWEQMGMNNSDSQFLETRKFQISDVARIFGVPPHLLGDLERATFSNIEQMSLEFVIHSLRPWLVRWEAAILSSLFTESERPVYFSEFLVDALLRGDLVSRYAAYNSGRQGGWLSVDEIRELENLNPLPNNAGKVYLEPLNMKEAGSPAPTPTQRARIDDLKWFSTMSGEILGRIVRKDLKFYSKKQPDLAVREFKIGQNSAINAGILPIISAILGEKFEGRAGEIALKVTNWWVDSAEFAGEVSPEERTQVIFNKICEECRGISHEKECRIQIA
mgnify:CR=1 FL=1